MSLLQPAALLWFALVAALLFLAQRRRTGRRVVSNLYLWRAAPRPDALQLRRRRSKHNLLVALQIAILTCLIFALARPAVEVGGRDVAFVVDVSASMGASHGTGTRLDAAKVQALGMVDRLAASTQVRVVAAAAQATDLGVFHAGDPRLRLAISQLEPTAGGAATEASIQRVTAVAAAATPICIFSDTAGRQRQSPDSDRIHWVLSGTAAGNLAISALAVRRLPEQPDVLQVLTTVRNYSGVPRDVEIEWSADGRAFARRRVHIAPGAPASVTLPFNAPEKTIAARLLSTDALDVDNQRFAVVPARRPLRVRLITGGSRFLESALRADSRVSLDVVPPSTGSANASGPFDVVVCDACERIPSGAAPVLLVGAAARPDDATSRAVARSHPVVAGLHLDNVPLSVRDDGARRIVELGIDLENSNLPLSVDFPLLVSNALTWLSASEENADSVIAGTPLRWRIAGPVADSVTVLTPDGSTVPARLQGTELLVVDTARVGRYEVRLGNGSAMPFTANPLVDGESDLRTAATPTAHPDLASVTIARTVSAVPFLVATGLLLLIVEWWYRRRLSENRRSPSKGSMLCRVAVATAMILTLAGPRIRAGEAPFTIAFVVDRSDSVSPQAQVENAARVEGMARARQPEDRAGLIAFAGDAAVERTPTDRFSMPASLSTLSTAATNIENAVNTALAQLQASNGPRIVLFSDGRETSGDVMRAAATAAAARVPIDIALPPTSRVAKASVSILRVAAPPQARVNEPYPISVAVEGPAGGSSEIRIDRSSHTPLIAPVTFDERGAGSVTITERQAVAGLYSYGVTAITEDDPSAATLGRTPDAGAVVAVHGQPLALYVSDAAAAPFAARLRSAGFRTTLAAADSVPRTGERLNAYDLVVLDEIPLEALHEGAAAALAEHVNSTAGGLLVMGSARSLSPAAVRSPLASAIPIDLRPRSGRRSPPAAMVIVFDKSGSMADTADGVAKIELARQAVLDVLDVVPSTDEIGVIAFSQSVETVAPLRAGHDPGDLAARLRALPPSGATAIAPAIETAIGWLAGSATSSAARRHIVLISDGRTSAADAERVRSAIARGIEISVVALGDSVDRAFLEEIARVSGGRAFFPRDLRQLPMLVAREAARVASGWRFEGPFQPKTTSHPLSANLPGPLPPLHGYVVGAAKQDAEPIVLSHLDDPVLAAWRFGLGRVAVFTSDIRTAAAASEAQQAALDAIWIKTARWITRQTGDPDLALTATENDFGVHWAVEAGDDRGFLDGLAISADVRSADGTHQRAALEQSAPGRYEAFMALGPPGPYTVAIAARGDAKSTDSARALERRLIRGFYRTSPEARARGVDTALLARVASTTGGRVLADEDNPFAGAREPGVVDLQPWLLMAALLLFFFEAARARVAVSAGARQWLQKIRTRLVPGRAA